MPAAEVLVLLDVVRLQSDAEEVIPQLALVALHPVNLQQTLVKLEMCPSRMSQKFSFHRFNKSNK